MTEGFDVEPAHVAGYSQYLFGVHEHIASVWGYVHQYGRADGRYRGLVGLTADMVNTNAGNVTTKLEGCWQATLNTSNELKRAAWAYTGAEESAYTEYTDMGYAKGYLDFPDPAPYHPSWTPDGPTEPVYHEADIEDVFDMDGVLGFLNDAIKALTGFDAMAALGELISGDWGALTYTGEVMSHAGKHIDAAANNVTAKQGTLREHWKGQAAEHFEQHGNQLAASVAYIGPIADLFGGLYRVLAHVIEFAARVIKDLIQMFADKLTNLNFFGILGKLWDLAEALITAFTMASDLYDLCKELIEGAKAVSGLALDFLDNANSSGLVQLSSKAEEFSTSLNQGADRLGKATDYGQIIVEGASDFSSFVTPAIDEMESTPAQAPPGEYEVGTPEGTVPR